MKPRHPVLKFLITALIACLIIIVIIAVSWKTLVLDFAENELRAVFKGSFVRIGNRDIMPGALIFRDIDVTTKGRRSLKTREFRINFTLLSLLKDRSAEFCIEETIIYDKLKIPEVRGLVRYSKEALAIGNVFARTLDGIVEGGAMIKLGNTPYYSAALKLKDIRLERVVEAFELNEKLNITGLVSGSLEVSVEGASLSRLKGKLATSPQGGTLTIKNKEWLDAIALYAKQDFNMIVENFKNYHYNKGSARLGLKGTSIVLDAHLSGESGKRDFSMSLHDFN